MLTAHLLSYAVAPMPNSGYIYHRLVVGYHGCDKTIAERVLMNHEPLEPSANKYDWLGEGIYFWEHGYKRALEFAQWKKHRGEIDEPTVIGAYIHLGRCFDLTDTAATTSLAKYYDPFCQVMEDSGLDIPQNVKGHADDFDLVKRFLDCAVLNFALESLPEIQTVRGVFVEGNQVFPGSQIYSKTHVQISVRDSSCILGYFLPSMNYNEI